MTEPITLSKPVRITPSPCPHCKYAIDAAAAFGPGADPNKEQHPEPGCCTICGNCGNWLVYNDQLMVRPITDREIMELTNDEFDTLVKAGQVLADVKARKRRDPVSMGFGRILR